MSTHQILHGVGVSAGTSAGPVVRVSAAPGVDAAEPKTTDPEAAGQRVREAMAAVAAGLADRASRAPEKTRAVLEATASLAKDRGLAKAVDKKLKTGEGVTAAVASAIEGYAEQLKALGGYMAERVTDLYDIRDRTIAQLRGLPAPGLPDLTEPSVVVAHDLAPAETATLDPATCLGIVTEAGGVTGHTAILAAQLGIPAVVQVAGALDLQVGQRVAVNGGAGEVIVDPTDAELEEFAERARLREEALAGSKGPASTKDGHKVLVLANIGTVDDAAKAAKFDVEGSGLFRSEFLFLGRSEAPTLEEQTETYTQVFKEFGDRPVTVRTLDAGADKPLAFASQKKEDNPALGVRGLRLSQVREDLFDTQLQAIAAAQKATGAHVKVMAPMVATPAEARYVAEKVRGVGLQEAGVMIEIPAAALRADRVLREIDFVSLGTNDLSQYTFAADRTMGELARFLTPWQPALLQLIKSTVDGAQAAGGKYVGVCGEAAGDPLLALVLTGIGVDSLSMAPKKAAAVKASLKMHDFETCKKMAAAALDADDVESARAAVLELADPKVKVLL